MGERGRGRGGAKRERGGRERLSGRERQGEGEGEFKEERKRRGVELSLLFVSLSLCCVWSACVCPPRTVTCWEAISSTQIYEEPISRVPICRMLLSKWLQSPDYQHK